MPSLLQETKISNRLSAPGLPLRAATQRTPALQQKDVDGTQARCARLDSFSCVSCCWWQPGIERQGAVKPSSRARANRPSDDQCSVGKFPGCLLLLMPTGDGAAKSRWNWQTGLWLAVCRWAVQLHYRFKRISTYRRSELNQINQVTLKQDANHQMDLRQKQVDTVWLTQCGNWLRMVSLPR